MKRKPNEENYGKNKWLFKEESGYETANCQLNYDIYYYFFEFDVL